MGKKNRTVLLTPVIETGTVELSSSDAPGGLVFRKKILPLGTITYPDPDAPTGSRKVTFDRAYHRTVIDAFKAHAIEAPTVQLADENNAHNMDLKRTAGTVEDVTTEQPGDVDGPGLYATIRARNEEHAALLHEMPRLGVSAQIKENIRRVDGQRFRAALRHVLVTADPRVVGLGPWRAVSLSSTEDDGPVIDLSDAEYEEMEPVAKIDTNDGTLSLSDDDIEAALEEAANALGDPDEDEDGDEGAGLTDDHAQGSTSLSTVDRGAYLNLAERLEARDIEVEGVKARLAAADWKAERLELSNAGVPKPLLDEAEKVLKHPGETVVSLSDEDGRGFGVDARRVIRSMLDVAKGAIDLSDVIPGSDHEPDLNLSNSDADEAFLNRWAAQAGF